MGIQEISIFCILNHIQLSKYLYQVSVTSIFFSTNVVHPLCFSRHPTIAAQPSDHRAHPAGGQRRLQHRPPPDASAGQLARPARLGAHRGDARSAHRSRARSARAAADHVSGTAEHTTKTPPPPPARVSQRFDEFAHECACVCVMCFGGAVVTACTQMICCYTRIHILYAKKYNMCSIRMPPANAHVRTTTHARTRTHGHRVASAVRQEQPNKHARGARVATTR